MTITTQPTQANPQASFSAVPKSGFSFSRWSDGNTQNPRTITVTQDTVIIAYFTAVQDISEAVSANIAVYPNPAKESVTIEGVEENTEILIVNAAGNIVKRIESTSDKTTFSVGDLSKGVYLVRVGTAVRKLIVE